MSQLLDDASIRFDSIGSRVKSLDSATQKLQKKPTSAGINDIGDLCGIRIVTYYQGQVQDVVDLLKKEFDVVEDQVHRPNQAETFGYTSRHLQLQLNSARAGLPEWAQGRDMQAEVQIRTVLQHAWALISHGLDYKSESSVPAQTRRKLFRVAALLETADDMFDDYRADYQKAAATYQQSIDDDTWRGLDIDAVSLQIAWEKFPVDELQLMALKLGYSRTEEDPKPDSDRVMFSDLAETAKAAGMSCVGDVEQRARAVLTKPFTVEKFLEYCLAGGLPPTNDSRALLIVDLLSRNPSLLARARRWKRVYRESLARVAEEVQANEKPESER